MDRFCVVTIFVLGSSLVFAQEQDFLSSGLNYELEFIDFLKTYGKSYAHDEFHSKYDTFKSNMDFIRSFNGAFELGVNQFADLTHEEFRKMYLGFRAPPHLLRVTPAPGAAASLVAAADDLPDTWDWRNKSAVTNIKDQGQCGSCWAFSATGSMEGCHALKSGELVSLSEENLVDCSGPEGNLGCNGGLMTQAFDYVIKTGGIDTEQSYPYTAGTGQPGKCKYSQKNSGATVTNYTNVQSGSETDLQNKCYTGPVSVAIDASNRSFQFYKSGVYNEPACSSTALDHGVLAIGWGNDPTGGKYWIVKNSWGTGWGMQGYIWMSRDRQNQCGIATMATIPHC